MDFNEIYKNYGCAVTLLRGNKQRYMQERKKKNKN